MNLITMENSSIINITMESFADGECVSFYDNRAVALYCVMKRPAYVEKLYEWHRNGKLKYFKEVNEKRKQIKTVRLDIDGNIIFLMENGKVKIDKG